MECRKPRPIISREGRSSSNSFLINKKNNAIVATLSRNGKLTKVRFAVDSTRLSNLTDNFLLYKRLHFFWIHSVEKNSRDLEHVGVIVTPWFQTVHELGVSSLLGGLPFMQLKLHFSQVYIAKGNCGFVCSLLMDGSFN